MPRTGDVTHFLSCLVWRFPPPPPLSRPEFLGDEMVKDKGLNCKLVVAKKVRGRVGRRTSACVARPCAKTVVHYHTPLPVQAVCMCDALGCDGSRRGRR